MPSPCVHVGQGFLHGHAVIDGIDLAIYFGIIGIKGSENIQNFSFFIRLLSFKHIHHNHIHVVSDKAGDPASSNELFKRSPQY